MREVVFEETCTIYDCGEDRNHPCWGGKQNGAGSCGNCTNFAVIKEAEDVFVVVIQQEEYDNHSVYDSDQISRVSEYEEYERYVSISAAKECIKRYILKHEYKPEEKYLPESYVEKDNAKTIVIS